MCLRWDFAAVAVAKGKGESDPPDKGLKDWPTLWTLKLADRRESIRASREIRAVLNFRRGNNIFIGIY